ncbi:GPP34 family phosphoprotein [Cryobacterium sp. 1639]|uniref:GOLPH3/VPS74 family protein n=1 Tax=Cryobacterium inferilacus TaxID=2866629 RepID=UPI001C72C579|nr:GPP34 family phosphoprotein [Cryobacterium sp. 1639]MBX0301126.1 GPP34 family phosphoprotein [Cryobacterium sp. 1639]
MTETATTPLVAEDLLLLLFDPSSGTFRGEGSALFHALAGAVLTELALAGQVQVDDRSVLRGRVVRAVGDPPADPLLRPTWQRLQKRPTDAYALILEIGPTLRAEFIDRLVERGHLRREPRRFLGLIPTTALVAGGTPRRDDLLRAVRPVLVDGVDPDQRTAALAALLSASGALPAMHREIPWSGDVYTRGVALQKGDWGAATAGDAVASTTAAILTNNLFLSLTLPGLRGD